MLVFFFFFECKIIVKQCLSKKQRKASMGVKDLNMDKHGLLLGGKHVCKEGFEVPCD